MKIASISMVKNEADIIESFVRHTLRFADVMYIIDHLSTDNTWIILNKLQAEGLPLILSRYTEADYSQAEVTTGLMWQSIKDGADWVLPLDADEFIVPGNDDISVENCRGMIRSLDAGSLHSWLHIEYFFDDEREDAFSLQRSLVKGIVSDGRYAGNNRNVAGKVILSKEIINDYQLKIGMGNHYVVVEDNGEERRFNGVALPDIHLAHFAYRSEGQLQAKGVIGWLHTVCKYSSFTDKAFHWQDIFQQVMSGQGGLLAAKRAELSLEPAIFTEDWRNVQLRYGELSHTEFTVKLMQAALSLADEANWLHLQLRAPIVDILVVGNSGEDAQKKTLESIYQQSYTVYNIHLIDDISIFQKTIVSECQGQYIQILYSGDVLAKDYLKKMLQAYSDDECKLVVAQFGNADIYKGIRISEHIAQGRTDRQYEYFCQHKVLEQCYSVSSILFKRDFLLDLQAWDVLLSHDIADVAKLWQRIDQRVGQFIIVTDNIISMSNEVSARDDVFSLYGKALELYRSDNDGKALHLLDELHLMALDWLRPLLLRAYILRKMKCFVQERQVLQDLLVIAEEMAQQRESDIDMVAEAWSLMGEVLVKLGECSLAVDAFLQSSRMERDIKKKREEYSNAIFAANYCSDVSDERWQELYAGYRQLLKDIVPLNLSVSEAARYSHEKIRVGYLSADLRSHPVAYFLRPLLEFYDREQFQVYLYRSNVEQDGVTERLQGWANCTRYIADMEDEEAAGQIAADEIDILVDLSGHTKDNRLPVLAYKPAPVILSGIGYFNSLGMDIDGFLSDVYCSPQETHPAFTEKLLKLPHTHFCYSQFEKFPAINEQMAWERNGYVTFGCFNNFSKVTDEMLLAWQKILCRCPGSRLLLKHKLFDSEEGRQCAITRMQRLALPVERIELRGFSAGYLPEYNDVDVALDTYPYTGGLTTVEALLMGVPVVSLYGNRHGTRFGLSFLCNTGIAALASADLGEYVQLACGLAADQELLAFLHDKLRSMVQKSPLMAGRNYVRDVEGLYRYILAAKR